VKKLFLISVLLIGFSLKAQDIHFSQFYYSPINLNPSLSGQFNGDYRIVFNHRSQWRSVTQPYKTFGVSADAANILAKQNIQGVNAGFATIYDRTGDSKFTTFKMNLSGGYSKNLTSDSIHSVSIGLQTGITQRSINYDALSFDNQYNGYKYDPNLSSRETFANDGRIYPNLNLGFSYSFHPKARQRYTAGMSFFNLTSPKQSFFNDNSIRLDRRALFFVTTDFMITPEIDLMPGLQFQRQGKFSELLVGSNMRYRLDGITAITGGFWYRNKDATYVTAGLEYDNITVGVSYDFNISTLKPASNLRGGLEIAVIYIFRKFRPEIKYYKVCPNYI
jgi:type IX secretion system PorP/SprF family membrane protein